MSTVVSGAIGLIDVDESSLSAKPAGYLVTLSEASGFTPPPPIAVALSDSSFSVALEPGTWTAKVQAVDAAGNAVGGSFSSAPYIVSAPVVVMVKMPNSVALGA